MPKETNFPVRKMISISEEMAKGIDEFRRRQEKIGSESEVIRLLIARGLEAAQQSAKGAADKKRRS